MQNEVLLVDKTEFALIDVMAAKSLIPFSISVTFELRIEN